jgi:hypothetical protein
LLKPPVDPDDRCRWVPFPCLFSLLAFEKHVQEKFPSHSQPAGGAAASSESHGNALAPKSDAAEVMTISAPAAFVAKSSSASAASPEISTSHAGPDVTTALSNFSSAGAASDATPPVAPAPISSPPFQFSSLSTIVSHLSQRYIFFVAPVNPKLYQGYSKVVKNPMSLSVITSKFVSANCSFRVGVACITIWFQDRKAGICLQRTSFVAGHSTHVQQLP